MPPWPATAVSGRATRPVRKARASRSGSDDLIRIARTPLLLHRMRQAVRSRLRGPFARADSGRGSRFIRRTLPVAPIAHVALEYNRGSGSCSCPAASRLRQCMKYPCDAALPPLRTKPGRQPREPRRYVPATAIPLPGYAARLAQGSPRPRDLVCRHYSPGSPPDVFVCPTTHVLRHCHSPCVTVCTGEIPGSGPLRLTPPTNF